MRCEQLTITIKMEFASCTRLLLTFVAILLGTLYALYKYSFLYWKKRNIPYLKPSIPFGNMQHFLTLKKSMGETYAEIYNEMGQSPLIGVFMVHRPVLVLKDPELIRNVLVKDFEHFHDHGFTFDETVDPLVGNLFMLTGKKWKDLRTDLTKTFTSGKMKRMFSMAVECGQELAEFLRESADAGATVEVKEVTAKYTTDIIASCAFGIKCNCFKNPDAEFIKYGRRMQELTLLDQLRGLMYMIAPKLAISLRIPLTPKCVSVFFRRVVKDIVDFRNENKEKRNDFIQLLLEFMEEKQLKENKVGLTMDQITAQVMIFLTGGFETSSSLMSFCLYELAMNLDIQELLRQEIMSVADLHGGVTYESVNSMKYLNQVVSETFRKYPPVSLLNRECNKTYKVPGTEMLLEQGTQVVVPVLGLHKDPNYYPEPEKFDPERFTSQQMEKRHHYVYLPFGEGPRICIGMRFGLMQIKIGLIYLLKNYEFAICKKTAIPPSVNPRTFITTAKEGISLQIRHR